MPAYCIWDNVEVTDPEKLEQYKQGVLPVVERYGGRYLVVGGDFDVVEGSWPLTYPVMIEFPSLEAAHRWYGSDEYAEWKKLRQSASTANAVFIEGLPNTAVKG